MDYIGILLTGITNPGTRPYFDKHLIREFKQAEALGYARGEFFHGLRVGCAALLDELSRNRSHLNGIIFENDADFQHVFDDAAIDLNKYTAGRFTGYLREDDITLMQYLIDLTTSSDLTTTKVPEGDSQTFPEYLNVDDNNGLAEAIRKMMVSKKPKDWAALYHALQISGTLKTFRSLKALHDAMTAYYGYIGGYSAFSEWTNEAPRAYLPDQLKESEKVRNLIKELENWKNRNKSESE